ncbi:DNA-binding transcriptional regulator LysR [compost metagenome]
MLSSSVTKAAKLMYATQPSVSKLIEYVETWLGYRLFERVNKRLVPTAETHALYREVALWDRLLPDYVLASQEWTSTKAATLVAPSQLSSGKVRAAGGKPILERRWGERADSRCSQ